MYKIQKWIMPELDVTEGSDHVNEMVQSLVEVSEPHILSYDTKDDIVYHTEKEILNALNNVNDSIISNYRQKYINSEDTSEARGELETLVNSVKEELNDSSNRYFMSLYDFIENKLISQINSKIGFKNEDDDILISNLEKYVITNKENKMLSYLNDKYIFTTLPQLSYTFDTKEEALEYEENISNEIEELTYIKILKNYIVIDPKEII